MVTGSWRFMRLQPRRTRPTEHRSQAKWCVTSRREAKAGRWSPISENATRRRFWSPTWTAMGWRHEVLLKYEDKLSRLTWNIMAVPTVLLPAPGVAITDTATTATFTKLAPAKPRESTPSAIAKKADEPEKPSEPRGLRL